jgi:AraC-like DNA-binding protein
MDLTSVTVGNIVSLVIKIIIYAGIIQGIYSAFVLTHTKVKNPANHYLAILMVVLSFCILHSTFIIPYFSLFHHISFQIKEPFILLVTPLIWLYVKKLNEPDYKFKGIHLFHFAPFLVAMTFSTLYLSRHKGFAEDSSLSSHALILGIFIYLMSFGQYVFYLFYMFRLIRSFKSKAYLELSNTENVDPLWLKVFLVTFISVFVMLVMMMIIAIHKLGASYFNNVVSVVFSFTIYVLGYKGMSQKTIMIVKNDEEIFKDKPAENKVDEQLLKRVIDYMVTQRPYHDPELSLTSLALQTNISRNQLSELINTGTGGNFYDFVNKYRVDAVKEMMVNPKYKDYTILAIAFEAGFPSKSTFNSIFKKFTGLTPSEYKSGLS